MPLSVDLECDLEELCAEHLRPWEPITLFFEPEDGDGDGLDLAVETFAEAVTRLEDLSEPLRALRIVGKKATAAELSALLRIPLVTTLEALMLPMCELREDGAKAIAAAPLEKLRLLDLRQTAIGDAGIDASAKSKLASRLEHLMVAGSFLTMKGLSTLLASPLGVRAKSLHVEEEDQPESLIPTMMDHIYRSVNGDARMAQAAFAGLIAHPSFTDESRAELRYQWDLVMSS